MKMKKLENFQNKRGLKGCNWSSLDAPGTETPQSHPYWELGELPFPTISPRGEVWRKLEGGGHFAEDESNGDMQSHSPFVYLQ